LKVSGCLLAIAFSPIVEVRVSLYFLDRVGDIALADEFLADQGLQSTIAIADSLFGSLGYTVGSTSSEGRDNCCSYGSIQTYRFSVRRVSPTKVRKVPQKSS
jgi:hypothetical protein